MRQEVQNTVSIVLAMRIYVFYIQSTNRTLPSPNPTLLECRHGVQSPTTPARIQRRIVFMHVH